jgi:hypothetical protein
MPLGLRTYQIACGDCDRFIEWWCEGGAIMGNMIWFSESTCAALNAFSVIAWVSRVDDRRIISGIISVMRNGLRCRDALAE